MIPIRVPPLTIHFHADRRLAFQVITAFGSSSPEDGSRSRVLKRDGERRLVEFHVRARDILGRPRTYRSVEWVSTREPHLVEFEGVEGPLPLLRDRFVLAEAGACARLTYESQFGLKGWVFGWLAGVLVVRPMMKRMMREHMAELKLTIEERARRSRVFPQRPCYDTSQDVSSTSGGAAVANAAP